jgi:predicted nucleotidyltransferase component of viral defense system
MKQEYLDVVRLLVRVAPVVFSVPGFALKGGSAINLFIRDLPRLSVDLDLVFTDHTVDRDQALATISSGVHTIAERAQAMGLQTHVPLRQNRDEAKLLIRQGRIEVKIEINQVLRGTLLPVGTVRMTPAARDQLKADLRLPVLAMEELYAGKLVAALDRNHPRDWFDILLLLRNEGLTPSIRRCFVAYLAAHNRPPHEILFGVEKPLTESFEREFSGMTALTVSAADLEQAQARVRYELPRLLDVDERRFLETLVRGDPEWFRLGIVHLARMPAIRWKLANLERLRNENPRKFKKQLTMLIDWFESLQ